MAVKTASKETYGKGRKKTSIGRGNLKMSSMNKSKKASHKRYRGQG